LHDFNIKMEKLTCNVFNIIPFFQKEQNGHLSDYVFVSIEYVWKNIHLAAILLGVEIEINLFNFTYIMYCLVFCKGLYIII
jgi:hypothetical protein